MAGHDAPRRRRLDRALRIGAALSLMAALLAGVALAVSGWGRAPAASAGRPVPVHAVPGQPVRIPPMKAGARPGAASPGCRSRLRCK
jgi:hypothetical protein